jgi:hypothetical protein
MMGAVQFYAVGCYIPPSDLEALTHIERAWQACPTGAHQLLVGNLNFNFRAPRTEPEETIAEQVDAMEVINMSDTSANARGKGSGGGGRGR